MKFLLTIQLCLLAIIVAGLNVADVQAQEPTEATAELADVDGNVVGQATLVSGAEGLQIQVELTGLNTTEGEHGIHVHEVGSCTPDFTAAGGHYNPFGAEAGQAAGDMNLQNMDLAADGSGSFEFTSDALTLGAGEATLFDDDGSAIVVHAEPNDEVGGAGARLACGIIVASSADMVESPAALPQTGGDSSSSLPLLAIIMGSLMLLVGGLPRLVHKAS
ncbi:MAG: superoxide dismutase family protein [Anaerolineae bacterium]|nr:superoxide dismutase family protein [Anaerolineae bacterium]